MYDRRSDWQTWLNSLLLVLTLSFGGLLWVNLSSKVLATEKSSQDLAERFAAEVATRCAMVRQLDRIEATLEKLAEKLSAKIHGKATLLP